MEIEAIGAEILVARTIGRPWIDTDRPDYDGDVGQGVQVRHTKHLNGRLILHDGDHDEHDFFLVVGSYPALEVVGWISGKEGKRVGVVRELQQGRPCICVEQSSLYPVAEWGQPLKETPTPETKPETNGSPSVVPFFVRKALLAQGLYDPDRIEELARDVDLDAPTEHEQLPLVEP